MQIDEAHVVLLAALSTLVVVDQGNTVVGLFFCTAIAAASDEALAKDWSLKRGGQVLFTSPKATVIRQHVSHLVHHRAQLGVYLRLLDVPVPSMYGPTADEGWGA